MKTGGGISRRSTILSIVMICTLMIAVTVLGCGWDTGTNHSVRFNPYHTEKEFSRLPPLPRHNAESANKMFSWHRDVDYDWNGEDNRGKRIESILKSASESEAAGRLSDLRQNLGDYLHDTAAERSSREEFPEMQKRRNTAIDKMDALGELDHGASEVAVAEYLAARREYDSTCHRNEVIEHLNGARKDPRLVDNADYLQAALDQDDPDIAAKEFEKLAARYPRSEKREAALYMNAVLTMKSSESYLNRQDLRARNDRCDDCRDKAWHRAKATFQRVIDEYPSGRYRADARGWLGYLYRLVEDNAQALVEYYKLLSEKNEAGRVEALYSLSLTRNHASDLEMDRVEKILENDAPAALAYAYHNIYNYAFRSDSDRWFYEDRGNESEEDENESETGKLKGQRRELERIASFATRMMKKFSTSSLTPGFVVRVAQADLELGRQTEADVLARRALRLGAVDDIRAEALWIAGVSEFRSRKYLTAREAFRSLIAEHPNDRYTEGARRQLAMLEEDSGNMEAALEQYLALDYRHDVAYFIDVLLTPAQLATFIDRHPDLKNRDELEYALGVRYLRDRDWSAARTAFGKVKPLPRDVDSQYRWTHENQYRDSDEEKDLPKLEEVDPTIRGVRRQWIDQDMRTANDLEALEHRVKSATNDEARAEALYQVASYEFERSLLFYNPLAWGGQRHYLVLDLDDRAAFRQPGESQILFDNVQRHDMASNSLAIFLEVARRFPNTHAAEDALYSAAVCHDRLSEYNGYWRGTYENGGHAGEQMVTYANVRAAYPRYRFPRGTFGWEPSTRTINGEAGFEKPPKPKPRPTRWARAAAIGQWVVQCFFQLLNRIVTDVEFVLKQVWIAIVSIFTFIGHWLWILAMCGWLWFLSRRACDARGLLKDEMALAKERPIEERMHPDSMLAVNPSTSMIKRYLNQDLRDAWLERVYDLEYKIRQVVSRKRGLSIVAYCFASHLVFVVLLLRLLIYW